MTYNVFSGTLNPTQSVERTQSVQTRSEVSVLLWTLLAGVGDLISHGSFIQCSIMQHSAWLFSGQFHVTANCLQCFDDVGWRQKGIWPVKTAC